MEAKIFHIIWDKETETDTIAAYSEEQALQHWVDEGNELEDIDNIVEIPESEWDERTITIWEDNDTDGESWEVTYRDELRGITFPATIASTYMP